MAQNTDIQVRLTAQGVDEVVNALKRVQSQAQQTGKASGKGMGLLNEALGDLKGLLPTLGIAGAVTGIASLAKSAVEGADQMAKLSKKTGISVETLSVLATGAELADVGMEGLTKGLKKMSVSLYELETGGGSAAEGFRQIGLGAKDLKGLKMDEAFVKVAGGIAKLPPGLLQTNAAIKIFGKNGAEMIPLLQDMANGGFEQLRDKLERTGRIMSTETAAQAEVLMDELKMLEKTTKGSALALASGMMPALLEVTRSMEDTAAESKQMWKSIGEGVGGFIQVMVRGAQGWGAFIGAMTTVEWGKLITDLDGFKKSWRGAMDAMDESLNGSLNNAIRELPDKIKTIREQIAKLTPKEQSEALGKLSGALGLKDPSKMVAAVEIVGRTVDSQVKAQQQAQAEAALLAQERAIKLSKDLSAAAQGAAANQLSVTQAQIKQQAQADKALYDDQLIDLRDYYQARRDEINKSNAAEIDALRKRRAAVAGEKLDPNDEGAAIKRKDQLASIDTQLRVKGIDRQTQLNALTEEEKKAVEDLGKRRLEIESQVLDAQGNTYEAALIRIRIQADELKKSLGKGSEGQVGALTGALTNQAGYAEFQKGISQSQAGLSNVEANLQNQVAAGTIFPFEAAQKYKEAVDALVPSLIAQLQAVRDLDSTTAEEKIQIDQQIVGLQQTQIAAGNAAQGFGSLKQSAEQALTSDLTNFFTKGIEEASSFGDAMRGLALSVVDSLRQIAAQMLATIATQQLLKAVGGMFGFSGGGLVTAAEGGYISGPGSGTSDSIPARLSNGEFVVRAAAVREPGVLPLLASINSGMGRPSLRTRGGVPGFADGGMVTAQDAMAQGLSVDANFGVDEGVIVRKALVALKSKDGQRAIIENIGKNQKATSRALGRG